MGTKYNTDHTELYLLLIFSLNYLKCEYEIARSDMIWRMKRLNWIKNEMLHRKQQRRIANFTLRIVALFYYKIFNCKLHTKPKSLYWICLRRNWKFTHTMHTYNSTSRTDRPSSFLWLNFIGYKFYASACFESLSLADCLFVEENYSNLCNEK